MPESMPEFAMPEVHVGEGVQHTLDGGRTFAAALVQKVGNNSLDLAVFAENFRNAQVVYGVPHRDDAAARKRNSQYTEQPGFWQHTPRTEAVQLLLDEFHQERAPEPAEVAE